MNICLLEPALAVIDLRSILGLIKILNEICSDLAPVHKNIPTLPSVRALLILNWREVRKREQGSQECTTDSI